MINKEKIKFWDRIFKTMIIGFIISIALVFIVSENTLENDLFVYPWLILFFIAIGSSKSDLIGLVFMSAIGISTERVSKPFFTLSFFPLQMFLLMLIIHLFFLHVV